MLIQPLQGTTKPSYLELKMEQLQVSARDAIFITYFSKSEKTVNLQENVNPDLLKSMREGVPSQLTGVPQRKEQENDAIPKIAPKWLKYDR